MTTKSRINPTRQVLITALTAGSLAAVGTGAIDNSEPTSRSTLFVRTTSIQLVAQEIPFPPTHRRAKHGAVTFAVPTPDIGQVGGNGGNGGTGGVGGPGQTSNGSNVSNGNNG